MRRGIPDWNRGGGVESGFDPSLVQFFFCLACERKGAPAPNAAVGWRGRGVAGLSFCTAQERPWTRPWASNDGSGDTPNDDRMTDPPSAVVRCTPAPLSRAHADRPSAIPTLALLCTASRVPDQFLSRRKSL